MTTSLLDRARSFEDDLIELRRDLHRHPELSFRETRTAAVVADRLETVGGYSLRRGVGRTGVVADLHGGGDGPVVALRADMDALPIDEANDVPYRSTVPGVMHACGHDAHTSMLVGAARLLAAARERGDLPPGSVRLLFQPSEEAADDEGMSGAARMIEDGAMEGVDAVFGLHVGAHLPFGRVVLMPGPLMAGSDSFVATVEGRSAHAARPQDGVDAIVLAAHAVLGCQHAVARRMAPGRRGVLTIGRIEGGVAENVLADHVVFEGTIRYLEDDVRATLHEALRGALGTAESLGARTRLDLHPGYPPVVNDTAMAGLAREAVVETLGPDAILDAEPMMEAEDFGLLAREAPGAFFWLGAALDPPREHHHPKFAIEERVLVRGASVLAACAIRALRSIAAEA